MNSGIKTGSMRPYPKLMSNPSQDFVILVTTEGSAVVVHCTSGKYAVGEELDVWVESALEDFLGTIELSN